MLLQKRKQTPDRGTAALKSALRVSAAAALIGLGSTSAASAGSIVEAWHITLNNAFTEATDTAGNTTDWVNSVFNSDIDGDDFNPNLMGGILPSKILWGVPFEPENLTGERSSISVGEVDGFFDSEIHGNPAGTPIETRIKPPFAPPAPDQDGTEIETVAVTHMNFSQKVPGTGEDQPDLGDPEGTEWLSSATLLDVLTVRPIAPPPYNGGMEQEITALEFNIRFLETPNEPDNGDGDPGDGPGACAGGPDSMANDGCDDIFVIDVPLGAVFDPILNTLNQGFEFEGWKYNAAIRLEDLGPLTTAQCEAVLEDEFDEADPFATCIGLTTKEGMENSFQAFLSIQLIGEAPEPGAVAIFGLGLAGLGFMRRRRKA